ncbi:hypothetical protein [Azorhizobium caulinodans]|uniref:hypothetical protein n=1 Tax=Azorhizobium caulinodans TaxID=7 RepID=UPI0002E8CBDE|nr:hypothetical protein [Azorhizobium caulinodans]
MRRRIAIAAFVLIAAALVVRLAFVTRDLPATLTAGQFETLRAELPRMRAFLARMPKGGDLHTHLSGAVYAERFIGVAVRDGLCLRRADWTLLPRPAGAPADHPCGTDPALVPLAEAVAGGRGQTTYDLLVNALSTRWFVPTLAVPSGHDQFFGTFGKFNAATGGPEWDSTARATAEMVVDQLRQYEAEQVQYAEFMVTLFEGEDRRRLAQALLASPAAAGGIDGQSDPVPLLEAVKGAGLADLVSARAAQLKDLVARIEALRGCAGDRGKPGCTVAYRFIAQVNRNAPPAEVFVQTAHAAALVRAAPGIVAGLNYVGPEDYRISLRDYRMHMRWIGALAGHDVPVALHAGELWLGLVPPPDLTFHIREAVEVAGARRIGHGTAIAFERDMDGLLAQMRRKDVAVEIALTSSDVILGVRGPEHPIRTYLSAGVPVVLSTDDAGVSRIDLTNEYFRAARDQGLGYGQLKAMARAAITHAFLPLDERQWQLGRLDSAFLAFERKVASDLPLPTKARLVARAMLPAGW